MDYNNLEFDFIYEDKFIGFDPEVDTQAKFCNWKATGTAKLTIDPLSYVEHNQYHDGLAALLQTNYNYDAEFVSGDSDCEKDDQVLI